MEAELDELLLHPAASPVHAMVSRATTGALFLVKDEIIPRTLPLIVAWRKEFRHHFGDSTTAGTNGSSHGVITLLAPLPYLATVDRVSTPSLPPPPDTEDLRGPGAQPPPPAGAKACSAVYVHAGPWTRTWTQWWPGPQVSPPFVKEMIRRMVLVSLRAGERPPVLRDAHLADVLAEMNSERHALTRSLLGVGQGRGEPAEAEPIDRPGPPARPRRTNRPSGTPPGRWPPVIAASGKGAEPSRPSLAPRIGR